MQRVMPYFCTMVRIRQLTTADAGILSKIGGKSLIESHGHSATPEIMQDYVGRAFNEESCLAELSDAHYLFYGIFYQDEPAGYYKIVLNKPHPAVPIQSVTYMERLYLLKEFYNLKLGQELMQHAIDLSKANGEQGMWLNVWKLNERAIRFYKKNGFVPVGESQFVLTETHSNPNWVMLLTYKTL